jgi:hypothetical protein
VVMGWGFETVDGWKETGKRGRNSGLGERMPAVGCCPSSPIEFSLRF